MKIRCWLLGLVLPAAARLARVHFVRGRVEVDDCVCSTATAKAILVVCEGEEAWIFTSQVHEDSEVYKPGTEGTLVIPRWGAEMKGLPYRETRSVR